MKSIKSAFLTAFIAVSAIFGASADYQSPAIQSLSVENGEFCGMPIESINMGRQDDTFSVSMLFNLSDFHIKGSAVAWQTHHLSHIL